MSIHTPKPLAVSYIPSDRLALPGRLGLAPMPGRVGSGTTGKHNRDLHSDMEQLSWGEGAKHLVSLMQPDEYRSNGHPLSEARRAARVEGMDFVHFPFMASDSPAPETAEQYLSLVQSIVGWLRAGECVIIHSRGGRGRCGLVASSVLVATGMPAEQAMQVVDTTKPRSIKNASQREFVTAFEGAWRRSRSDLTTVVTEALDASEWSYERADADEVNVISFQAVSVHGTSQAVFGVFELTQQVRLSIGAPFQVPEPHRAACAVFLAQATLPLPLGTFLIDLSDGTVAYRADLVSINSALSQQSVLHTLANGLWALDLMLALLRAVAYGEKDPNVAARELLAGG